MYNVTTDKRGRYGEHAARFVCTLCLIFISTFITSSNVLGAQVASFAVDNSGNGQCKAIKQLPVHLSSGYYTVRLNAGSDQGVKQFVIW